MTCSFMGFSTTRPLICCQSRYHMKQRAVMLRDWGAAMIPINAFLFLQGLETLSLRMARHVENAAAVANYLDAHELASGVTWPGLRSSRYGPLVDKYLP